MKRPSIRMTDELHAELVKLAKQSGRSLQSEMTIALEEWIRVPIIGKIKADGTVEIEGDYWNTPAGIEQSR